MFIFTFELECTTNVINYYVQIQPPLLSSAESIQSPSSLIPPITTLSDKDEEEEEEEEDEEGKEASNTQHK